MDQYWSASEAVLVAILTSTTLHVDQYCSRRRPVLITFVLLYRALSQSDEKVTASVRESHLFEPKR